MGIKGPSVLGLLPGFDIVKGFVPDYMHCVGLLLGVTRHFVCDLWFDTSNNGRQFYRGPQIETINERLQNIKCPHEITRTPRSLKTVKYWKASEWRAFLLFYSLYLFSVEFSLSGT